MDLIKKGVYCLEGITIKEDKKKITATFIVTAVIVKDKTTDFETYGWKELAREKLRQLITDKVLEMAIKEITNITHIYGYYVSPYVVRSIILMNPKQIVEILSKAG